MNTWTLDSEADLAPEESEHAFLYLSIDALTLKSGIYIVSFTNHFHQLC